ncbi:MAG: helix-turn-helix transcriptional regulator [Deinococcota bacterium]
MNDVIRQQVRDELAKRDMNQSQLAAKIGVSRQYLSNVLRGVSGKTPSIWQQLLDELELELVVQPTSVMSEDLSKQTHS